MFSSLEHPQELITSILYNLFYHLSIHFKKYFYKNKVVYLSFIHHLDINLLCPAVPLPTTWLSLTTLCGLYSSRGCTLKCLAHIYIPHNRTPCGRGLYRRRLTDSRGSHTSVLCFSSHHGWDFGFPHLSTPYIISHKI